MDIPRIKGPAPSVIFPAIETTEEDGLSIEVKSYVLLDKLPLELRNAVCKSLGLRESLHIEDIEKVTLHIHASAPQHELHVVCHYPNDKGGLERFVNLSMLSEETRGIVWEEILKIKESTNEEV